jgi:hypothetical protein
MRTGLSDRDSPHVVAAQVARAQTSVDRWALVSILFGLAFTTVNVQQFAAAGAPPWSMGWCAAWLLDPMVSILLLVVVRAEQVTARWQVRMGWPVTATKWGAFGATYVMNTWSSWSHGIPSAIVLHSVPPMFVLIGAELAPALSDRLTEALNAACRYADTCVATPLPAGTVSVQALGNASADHPSDRPAVDLDDESDPPTDPEAAAGEDADVRVALLVELLRETPDMSGPTAEAALRNAGFPTSERTARRLLGKARESCPGSDQRLASPADEAAVGRGRREAPRGRAGSVTLLAHPTKARPPTTRRRSQDGRTAEES